MGLLGLIKKFFSAGKSGSGSAGDRTLRCMQCRNDFVFEAGEQEFYRQRGLSEPKRCPDCRKQNRSGRRGRRRR
ncbi:MAG: zinc-ribbon domain containing protein [Elusimicrobiota bacterium]